MEWLRGEFLWMRASREQTGVIFVIRRKVGNAVKRNRLKRRLRSIVRCLERAPRDTVVLAREGAAEANFQTLRSEFSRLCSQLAERTAR